MALCELIAVAWFSFGIIALVSVPWQVRMGESVVHGVAIAVTLLLAYAFICNAATACSASQYGGIE